MCLVNCLTPLQKYGGVDCDDLGARTGEIESPIFAVCNFQWNSDVKIPGDASGSVVTIGASTDAAEWKKAIDNGLITILPSKVTEGDESAEQTYRCGSHRTDRTTKNYTVEVIDLPLNDFSDYNYFCDLKQKLGKSSLKLIGMLMCDDSIEFVDKTNKDGVKVGGNFVKKSATEDKAYESWEAELSLKVAGAVCQERIDFPELRNVI